MRARERDGDGTPMRTSFLAAAARVEGVYASRMDEDQEQVPGEPAELVEDELLVEEISIDGMCGVY
jgi:mycofactocin precursor